MKANKSGLVPIPTALDISLNVSVLVAACQTWSCFWSWALTLTWDRFHLISHVSKWSDGDKVKAFFFIEIEQRQMVESASSITQHACALGFSNNIMGKTWVNEKLIVSLIFWDLNRDNVLTVSVNFFYKLKATFRANRKSIPFLPSVQMELFKLSGFSIYQTHLLLFFLTQLSIKMDKPHHTAKTQYQQRLSWNQNQFLP